MRIAFLLTSSLDSPYGLGRCYPLARQLVRQGHEAHVVALHHDLESVTGRQYCRQGVEIHYAGQMHVRKVGDATLYPGSSWGLLGVVARGMVGITRTALRLNADIYHLGKPHPQNGAAGMIAALRRRSRLVVDCDDLETVINRFGSRWQRRGLSLLEEHLPRWADGVTVHSRWLEERLRDLGVAPDRLHRLPTGADVERFERVTPEAADAWRQRLDLAGKQVVACIGTMALQHHPVDLLVDAFAELAPRVPRAVLLLVGGGVDLDALKARAERLGIGDRCRFTGRVSADDAATLQTLADVSVDPVRDDLAARSRWPLKIIESLATGVPVVTGDIGDRREMLGDGTAGMLVPPGEAPALADALEAVLADPELHQRLHRGCRARVADYDLAKLSEELVGFYERLSR